MRLPRVRLLPRTDISLLRDCDALATSANAGLVGNANPNFWRFTGRRNADGALHRAAGPRLLEACIDLAAVGSVRCGIGEAVTTPAFDLHAAMVIHAVSPDGLYGAGQQRWWGRRQWSGGQGARDVHLEEAPPAGEANELLSQTYGAVLAAANEHGVQSVAIPAIGAGVLGFAAGRTAKAAVGAFRAHDARVGTLDRIDVALLDDSAFRAWSSAFRALLGEPQAVDDAGVETYDLRRT